MFIYYLYFAWTLFQPQGCLGTLLEKTTMYEPTTKCSLQKNDPLRILLGKDKNHLKMIFTHDALKEGERSYEVLN